VNQVAYHYSQTFGKHADKRVKKTYLLLVRTPATAEKVFL
jgi:hypothetical protein